MSQSKQVKLSKRNLYVPYKMLAYKVHVKVKMHTSQRGPQGWSLTRFLKHESMPSLGVLILLPGQDARPWQDYPQNPLLTIYTPG